MGANVHEAQNSESKNDFIHKIKITTKEFEETKYWLILCDRVKKLSKKSIFKSKSSRIGTRFV
jgi:four helix bundle protein